MIQLSSWEGFINGASAPKGDSSGIFTVLVLAGILPDLERRRLQSTTSWLQLLA
jgi:hypothetical protein